MVGQRPRVKLWVYFNSCEGIVKMRRERGEGILGVIILKGKGSALNKIEIMCCLFCVENVYHHPVSIKLSLNVVLQPSECIDTLMGYSGRLD